MRHAGRCALLVAVVVLAPRSAFAAARDVVVLGGGTAFREAVTLALSPWDLHVVTATADTPPPSSDAPRGAAEARALTERYEAIGVVWVAGLGHEHALFVYDAETDQLVSRPLKQSPPFDTPTAASAALSVKTLLRSSTVAPPAERIGAAPARTIEPPPSPAEPREEPIREAPVIRAPASASASASAIAVEVSGAARAIGGDVDTRLGLGGTFWFARPGLGVGITGHAGPDLAVESSRFRGRFDELSIGPQVRYRIRLGHALDVEPVLGMSVHATTIDGVTLTATPAKRSRLDASADVAVDEHRPRARRQLAPSLSALPRGLGVGLRARPAPRLGRPPAVGRALVMRMRLALAGLGLLVPFAACGRENVELAPPTEATPDASATSSPPPEFPDGSLATSCDAGTRACRPLDSACVTATECCSGRCEGSTCLPAGACKAASSACAARSECCSGRCEPVAGTTNRACAPSCHPDGASCTSAADCCSLGCSSGACAALPCATEGRDCSTASDCCSGECASGKCRLDPVALCRPSGEDCTSGGGAPCCYGCVNGRCDVGPGPCRPRGAPCAVDGDCCGGSCAQDANSVRRCSAPCGGDGASCSHASDCCSGACTAANGGHCTASDAGTCALVGEPCDAATACCTGTCFAGRCADNCPGAVR